MDNRKYTRLPIDIMVELRTGDSDALHYGETADVSIDGAFITMPLPEGVTAGQACRLELVIKTEDGWVRVGFDSTIAHLRDEGIGVQFNMADTAHHESFLRLIMEGAGDMDQLLTELGNYSREDFRFTQD
jgi:hypothetical protein